MTPLLAKNPFLEEVEPGLWAPKEKARKAFSYSDGQQSEQYLTEVLQSTDDLSFNSEKLENMATDWPSRYHLSSKRHQIISALNLKENSRFLEVGCGCGAITRYLADQGHYVDAIEGSYARAHIARLRCEDNPGVNIISSNFNDLQLPADSYDIVLFIGVLEYALLFGPQYNTPEQAVVGILKCALDTLTPTGCVIFAIENRIGFKYAFGASEDHFGTPYIGMAGYPSIPGTKASTKHGIATFDQNEWHSLLGQLGKIHHCFYYPFPDYKLPEILLSESFTDDHPEASNLVRKTLSFDPRGNWSPPINEYAYWRYAALTNTLGKTANSFGVVLSRQQASVDAVLDFDFVCFANPKRKTELQTRVIKQTAAEQVARSAIMKPPAQAATHRFRLKPQPDHYRPGKLALDYWADILQANPEQAALEYLIKEMQQKKLSLLDADDDQYNFDLTILNILVDAENHWHVFDREWFDSQPVSIEILMFRSLLYFACIYPDRINFTRNMGWHSVFDFVDGCFALLGWSFPAQYIDLVSTENEFQQYALKPQFYIPAEARLSQPLGHDDANKAHKSYRSRLYVADGNAKFTEQRSLEMLLPAGAENHQLTFTFLEARLEPGKMLKLRFDPIDETAEFGHKTLTISEISVCIRQDGGSTLLWSGNHPEAITKKLKAVNMKIIGKQPTATYRINHHDPQLYFEHPLPDTMMDIGCIHFTVNMALYKSKLISCFKPKWLTTI